MVTHGPWRLLLSVGRSVVSNFGVSKFVFCCGPHALIGPFLTLHDEQKIHDQGKGLMPKPREICARTGTYVRNKASRIETKEIVLSSPAEKKDFERLSRAPECMDRAETWTNVSGRASCAREFDVGRKALCTKRKVVKITKI